MKPGDFVEIVAVPSGIARVGAAEQEVYRACLGLRLAVARVEDGGVHVLQLHQEWDHFPGVAPFDLRFEAACLRPITPLDHPHVVPVHALARDEAGPVLVMKRIEGTRWGDLPRDPARDVEILLQVCDALRFAHARGHLHRDLKPDNVMVGAFGETYVMDWGCATPLPATTSDIVGTPHYLAPEMLEVGAALTPATDVFLLGATWYRLVTGLPRHRGRAALDVLTNAWVCLPPPFPDDLPAELAALLARATAREPQDRFPTVEAFADAVRAYRAHQDAAARAHRAARRLPELRAKLAAGDPAADDVLTDIRAACRSALEDWPAATEAREALTAAVEAAWPARAAVGAFDAALALAAELPPERAAVVRAELGAARAARDRAHAAARDADLGVGAAARGRIVGGMLLAGTVLLWGTEALRWGAQFTPSELGRVGIATWLVSAVPLLALRHQLGNRVSRTIVDGLALVITAALVGRLVGWWTDTPTATTLRAEALTDAVVLTLLGLATDRRLAAGALGFWAVLPAIVRWPELASSLYPAGLQVCMVALFLVVRSPPAPEPREARTMEPEAR